MHWNVLALKKKLFRTPHQISVHFLENSTFVFHTFPQFLAIQSYYAVQIVHRVSYSSMTASLINDLAVDLMTFHLNCEKDMIENIKSMLDEIYRIFNQNIHSDINEM